MMAEQTINKEMHVLTWGIGERVFGIEIENCRDVERDKNIVPVPHSREQIAGIVNLRGEIVTVLDLHVLLGNQKSDENAQSVLIRLKSKTNQVAIKADAVYDVIMVSPEQMEGTPAHLSDIEVRLIKSVAMTDRGLVVILSPDEILKSV